MVDESRSGSKTVSFSELSSYMECPRKHYYAYIERLRKAKYTQSGRINVGLVVHALIQAALLYYIDMDYKATFEEVDIILNVAVGEFFKQIPDTKKFMDMQGNVISEDTKERDEFLDNINLAIKITQRLVRHLDIPNNWRTEFINWNGEEVPLIEFKFEYPVVEGNDIVGKIDWVAKSLFDNQVYLIDWKTRAKMTDGFKISGEDMNLQMSIYQYVLNSLGVNTFGTITYQVRSDIPHEPEITKKGKMSEAKIATDWETYKQHLLNNGEDPNNYDAMKNKIESLYTEDYWWLPVYIIRGNKELTNRWLTVQEITDTMLHDTKHSKYESPRCQFCPYFQLCLNQDRGMDVEYIKKMDYTKDEARH